MEHTPLKVAAIISGKIVYKRYWIFKISDFVIVQQNNICRLKFDNTSSNLSTIKISFMSNFPAGYIVLYWKSN